MSLLLIYFTPDSPYSRSRLPLVQPNGRELLSKGRTVAAPPLGPGVAGYGSGLGLGTASALRTVDWRGLTSRLQDGLEGLPALGGAELVGVGEVVLRRHSAEEGFLVLVGRGRGRSVRGLGGKDRFKSVNLPWTGLPSAE